MIKYTIVYIVMVSVLASLIMLRELLLLTFDPLETYDGFLVAALFKDRIKFDCRICRNI